MQQSKIVPMISNVAQQKTCIAVKNERMRQKKTVGCDKISYVTRQKTCNS
jgi:hypothetical protein